MLWQLLGARSPVVSELFLADTEFELDSGFQFQKSYVVVSGMCRFKGLVLSTMNRLFPFMHEGGRSSILKVLPAKKTGSGFSLLLLESSSNRKLII